MRILKSFATTNTVLPSLFRRYLKENSSHPNGGPTNYAVIFLNVLRGTDRLLTQENGYAEALQVTAFGTDLFIRGITCKDQPVQAPIN